MSSKCALTPIISSDTQTVNLDNSPFRRAFVAQTSLNSQNGLGK